jgi:hypothetical protein
VVQVFDPAEQRAHYYWPICLAAGDLGLANAALHLPRAFFSMASECRVASIA